MKSLVTGGCGLIDGHFIPRQLPAQPCGDPVCIVNLDTLAYAAGPNPLTP